MQTKYERVKTYYESALWDKTRVRNAVVKGWITAEEYERIIEASDTEWATSREDQPCE
jgi:hypothetical protein